MSMGVHLVLINQYYPPDEAPTGLMLEVVAGKLVEQGHRVTVICSAGGYAGGGAGREPSESGQEGVVVLRVGATSFGRQRLVGKLIDYASYYLGVVWKLLSLAPSPDRVVALTTPPYLALLARFLGKLRGADHAHWVMDLYPDVMVAHGMLEKGGLGARMLGSLTRLGFGGKRCAAVVTLGPDMAESVSRYLSEEKKVEWVPLWNTDEEGGVDLEAAGRAMRCERGWADDDLVLMYSGNMGLGHRFGEFLEAAGALQASSGRRVRFAFVGGGKRKAEIAGFMVKHPKAAVELHDYVPRDQLAAHLRSADIHLASLEPSWDGTMVPSKLQGIMATGLPVIFVGSESCSIGRWVLESRGGWVVPPNEKDLLIKAIESAGAGASQVAEPGEIRRYASEHFGRVENSTRVAEMLGLG
jgi:hypothetical protein